MHNWRHFCRSVASALYAGAMSNNKPSLSTEELKSRYRAPILTAIFEGMPPPPPPELDPYLDAAARCFARYGLSRTSVQDVANEMGYNRATVYRKIGTVDAISRLLFAREVDRFLATLTQREWEPPWPGLIVELMAGTIEYVRAHPVVAKLLADEMDSTTVELATSLASARDQFIAGFAPPLRLGMQIGLLAQRDPEAIAEWIFRMLTSSIALPPVGDLRQVLSEVIVPVLSP
ncbi:TetR/AcrR family transcriptional regulator [Nocardia brasiliensis]|uniref:TetR/AcrR family transcriptional regulator n=1 Tax=Nocardia brasiliensis TaxID=37326 RepID=UPI0036700F11